jgi:hypothetical protein
MIEDKIWMQGTASDREVKNFVFVSIDKMTSVMKCNYVDWIQEDDQPRGLVVRVSDY